MSETNENLPFNLTNLEHQVAGHNIGSKSKLDDGLLLKPEQAPPRGTREHDLYKKLFESSESLLNQDQQELKSIMPKYYGSYTYDNLTYIKMDNIAFGLKFPAVIDFKMGKRTHDPEENPDKIAKLCAKYPYLEKIGFQMIGMRVFNSKENNFMHFDKFFGRSLNEEGLVHGIALYYQFHETPKLEVIRETIKKLESIKIWFEKQKTYHFYSSSLIVAYEANLNEINDVSSLVRVKLIDFAHVFPANDTCDENVLFGLKKLIEYLQKLLQSDYVFKDIRNKI